MLSRLLLVGLAALLVPSSSVAQTFSRTQPNVQTPSATAVERLQSIDHFIVLMLENESFDQLFPSPQHSHPPHSVTVSAHSLTHSLSCA